MLFQPCISAQIKFSFLGDIRGAGTDAEVYVILYGGRKGNESSGKIALDGKFERYLADFLCVVLKSVSYYTYKLFKMLENVIKTGSFLLFYRAWRISVTDYKVIQLVGDKTIIGLDITAFWRYFVLVPERIGIPKKDRTDFFVDNASHFLRFQEQTG